MFTQINDEYAKDAALAEVDSSIVKMIARKNITRVDGIWQLTMDGKNYSSPVLSDLVTIISLHFG